MQIPTQADGQASQAQLKIARTNGIARQEGVGIIRQVRQALSITHEFKGPLHVVCAQLWQAGLMVPASVDGAPHMLAVHAQRSPPQLPPVGPLEPPRQQRPAHHPQLERAVQLRQSLGAEHSSEVTVSIGTVPLSVMALVAHCAYAVNCPSQPENGKVVEPQLALAVRAQVIRAETVAAHAAGAALTAWLH